jgi:hypothetical protein
MTAMATLPHFKRPHMNDSFVNIAAVSTLTMKKINWPFGIIK